MNNSERVFTSAARQAQAERGSAKAYERRIAEGFPDRVTRGARRRSLPNRIPLSSRPRPRTVRPISSTGVGRRALLKLSTRSTLGFADYRGNRQYITLANLSENDRAFLFLLDPARQQRIKLWGRARVVENDPALIERLFDEGYKARPERAILFTIEAWDVNCSSHIVTRFTEAEDRTGVCRRAAPRSTSCRPRTHGCAMPSPPVPMSRPPPTAAVRHLHKVPGVHDGPRPAWRRNIAAARSAPPTSPDQGSDRPQHRYARKRHLRLCSCSRPRGTLCRDQVAPVLPGLRQNNWFRPIHARIIRHDERHRWPQRRIVFDHDNAWA